MEKIVMSWKYWACLALTGAAVVLVPQAGLITPSKNTSPFIETCSATKARSST